MEFVPFVINFFSIITAQLSKMEKRANVITIAIKAIPFAFALAFFETFIVAAPMFPIRAVKANIF